MVAFGHVAGSLISVIAEKNTERENFSGKRQKRACFWAKTNGLARVWAETGFSGKKSGFRSIARRRSMAPQTEGRGIWPTFSTHKEV